MSSYAVGYQADFEPNRSRLTTFFRYFMAIPVLIVAMFWVILALLCTVIAFFALLFTARYPAGLYDFVAGVVRFLGRLNGYLRLITDTYPPFDTGEHSEYPIRIPIAPPKEKYSRLKVFFRFIFGIPVLLINYALNILGNVCAVISWVVIVITGKQNEGLQNALNLTNAYAVRTSAYFMYLTEDWPPFSVEETPGDTPAFPDPPPAPEAPTAG